MNWYMTFAWLSNIILLPVLYVKLSMWWTDREVNKIREQIKDVEGEKIHLLKLMIEEYDSKFK